MSKTTSHPIIILGMHKSGTTLLAEILHRTGIVMVDGPAETGGYDSGQKMERARAQTINKTYLACGDAPSNDVTTPARPDPARHAACLAQAKEMITDLSSLGAPPWGFKDPRTLLCLPLWLEAFDTARIAPQLIGIYRHPIEVFGHYKRLLGRKWLHRDPGYLLRVLNSWCAHNRALHDLARRHADLVLFEFTALMTEDAEMARLAQAIAAPLEDMRQAGMYRARERDDRDYRIARALLRLQGQGDPEKLMNALETLRAAQIIRAQAA